VKDIAIQVRNVTKDFEVYNKPVDLALEILTRKKRHRTFRALDDVSF
jgi:ABC-type polysaccharide/polyol phosphate transport system ATPase subunit